MLRIFHRWHPQLALRYLPIVSYIKKSKLSDSRILEIGSGSLGIGPYFNQTIIAVDVDFTGPNWKNLKKITGSVTSLPFANSSFDTTISVDLLEHLPKTSRLKALAEQLRVTRKIAIIAVPLGQKSSAQDQLLSREYQQKFSRQHPFLQDHLKYGLPKSEKEISQLITQAAIKSSKKITFTIRGNRNLSLRLWLMRGWMSKSLLTNILFRKILLLFLPFLSLMDRYPPHYRQIFFVKIRP